MLLILLCSIIFFTLPCNNAFSIDIPKRPHTKFTYQTLPGSSEKDKENIYDLFYALGNKGKLELLLKVRELMNLGEDIKHVHPLRLLGHIFSQKELVKAMEVIEKSKFKWPRFFTPLKHSIETELKINNLNCHLEDFAKEIDISSKKLKPFFHHKNWVGLVKFLIGTAFQM